jgi:RNA recognition motif-containing protein
MSARLFVGNLPFDVTEAELRELFSPVGPLSYVFLPVDRETGKKRGFAFVEFAEEAKAAEALRRFNEQQFKGRPLALSEARARDAARPAPSFAPSRPRVPRLPEPFDPAPGLGDAGARRDRRGREDSKKHTKQSPRNVRTEGVKRGPRRERAGGRVYGLDIDDNEDDFNEPLDLQQDEEPEEVE